MNHAKLSNFKQRLTHFSAFCEKPANPAPHPRAKRDQAAIRKAMLNTAAGLSTTRTSHVHALTHPDELEDIGLLLAQLEDQRWRVSAPVAREKLTEAGIEYAGRRAGQIYSWPSIFKAEGIDADLANTATRESHPHLFDDLLDTTAAAAVLRFRDASSIRKLIIAGALIETSFVRFGTRGVYRLRPAALTALRQSHLIGKIV